MKYLGAILLALLFAVEASASSSWSGDIKCSYGSGSLSLNVDDNGAVTGGVTNGKVRSGRVSGSSITFNTSNFMGNRTSFVGVISGNSMSGTYTQTANGETCTWFASRTGGGSVSKTGVAKQSPKAVVKEEPGLIENTGQMRAILKANVYGVTMAEVRTVLQQNLTKVVSRELDYYDKWVTAHRKLKISQKKIEELDSALRQQMEAGRQRDALRTFNRLKAQVSNYKKHLAARDSIARE